VNGTFTCAYRYYSGFILPKNQQKRAVNRRARQTKTPKSTRSRMTALEPPRSTTSLWNAYNGVMPFFHNVQRLDNEVYRFSQILNLGTIYSTSATIPTMAGLSPTATSAITQATTFAALFDQYRFDSIEIWLTPNSSSIGPNSGSGLFYSSVDYDNATAVAPSALAQKTNVVVSNHNSGHYHRWVPHVATAAYSGAFTSFANVTSPWLDWSSPGIQHYGLLIASEATPIGVQTVDAVARVNFSCRNIQ